MDGGLASLVFPDYVLSSCDLKLRLGGEGRGDLGREGILPVTFVPCTTTNSVTGPCK